MVITGKIKNFTENESVSESSSTDSSNFSYEIFVDGKKFGRGDVHVNFLFTSDIKTQLKHICSQGTIFTLTEYTDSVMVITYEENTLTIPLTI